MPRKPKDPPKYNQGPETNAVDFGWIKKTARRGRKLWYYHPTLGLMEGRLKSKSYRGTTLIYTVHFYDDDGKVTMISKSDATNFLTEAP